MEIGMPFNFLTLFFLSSFIFLLAKLWKKHVSSENLPPGPPQLPLIGNLHQLLLLGGPLHHALQLLARKYGPVLHLRLGQVSAVVISSREAAKEVLKTQDPACADRFETMGTNIMWYNSTDIVFSPYGDYWKRMRKACLLELLSPKIVKSFGPIRQDEAHRLVKSLLSSSGKPTNLTDNIYGFMTSVMFRVAFSKMVVGDSDALEVIGKKSALMGAGLEVASFFPSIKVLQSFSWNRRSLLSMRRKVDSILDGIFEERKRNGECDSKDIVDILLGMQRNEVSFTITNDNIKAFIFDLFSAGTETSSALLDWAMVELMRNPRVMAKAQAEIREAFKGKQTIKESDIQPLKYLKLVMKETLRLHPPATLIPRECRDECKVNGYTIPLKSRVIINLGSLGRDPEYWHEPETFQPERFEDSSVDFLGTNFEYIPFGAGKRMCPAVNLGLVIVEVPLAHLLYHFDWEMPKGSIAPGDMNMTAAEGITSPRKNSLFLVPRVYDPSKEN